MKDPLNNQITEAMQEFSKYREAYRENHQLSFRPVGLQPDIRIVDGRLFKLAYPSSSIEFQNNHDRFDTNNQGTRPVQPMMIFGCDCKMGSDSHDDDRENYDQQHDQTLNYR